jgi:hypothetical protein
MVSAVPAYASPPSGGGGNSGQFGPQTTTTTQGVSPQIAYTCYYTEFAGKSGTPTNRDIWGQQYVNCTSTMDHVQMYMEAWWCQPIAWGCVWFKQGTMVTCDHYTVYPYTNVWCPKDQTKGTWHVNHLGDLWGVKFWYKTWALDGTYAEKSSFIQVQT